MATFDEAITFVLLPGLDGTGLLAQPFLTQFPDRKNTELIVYPQNTHDNLEDLAILVEQKIAINPNCVFIAESFGGFVMLELLRRGNVSPRGIIFVAAFGESPKPKLLSIIKRLPIEYFPWAYVPNWLLKLSAIGVDVTNQQVQLVRKTSRSVSPRILASRLRIIANNPMKTMKNRWSIPCLYLQATHDKVVPDTCANWFAERFTDFTLKRIEGGHFLLHTRVSQCIEFIEEFKLQIASRLIKS